MLWTPHLYFFFNQMSHFGSKTNNIVVAGSALLLLYIAPGTGEMYLHSAYSEG